MREIKFRAWIKDDDIPEGYMVEPADNLFVDIRKGTLNIRNWEGKVIPYPEDSYVLMQYSGIKDDNNKEIYEGDIAKIKVGHMETYNAKVLFDVGAFIFEDVNIHQKYVIWESLSRCVIIGNIYENPEFLGV